MLYFQNTVNDEAEKMQVCSGNSSSKRTEQDTHSNSDTVVGKDHGKCPVPLFLMPGKLLFEILVLRIFG
jgi:hypothetical protein